MFPAATFTRDQIRYWALNWDDNHDNTNCIIVSACGLSYLSAWSLGYFLSIDGPNIEQVSWMDSRIQFFIAHSWVLHPRHSPRSDACCMGRSWINWGGFTLVNPFTALASKSWHPAFLCRRYEAFGLGASQNLIFEQCINASKSWHTLEYCTC